MNICHQLHLSFNNLIFPLQREERAAKEIGAYSHEINTLTVSNNRLFLAHNTKLFVEYAIWKIIFLLNTA
jgi:hypothetical protein